MRIRWVRPTEDLLQGIGFGYSAASAALGRAVAAAGVELADDAPVALHFDYPLSFEPEAGVKNVLFTMYEATPLPAAFVPVIRQADAVIVPSRFCYDLFRPHLRGIPLVICPLGFDPEVFYPPEVPRTWPGIDHWRYGDDPLSFLWNGAPNSRKGWDRLTQSWSFVLRDEPWCRMLFKTTDENSADGMVYRITQNTRIMTRTLPWQELGDLYRSAHCTVLPSHGEGFGLTALEALACACPTIVTRYGGVLDFCTDKTAFFAPHEWATIEYELGPARYAFAKLGGLAKSMLLVAKHYDRAVERGLHAADFVRRRFTWSKAAERFVALMAELGLEAA